MLPTSAFFQLAPSVVQRIRNKYRVVPRTSLPTRLSFLANSGVDSAELDALRDILLDEEEERLAAAYILLRLFRDQTFYASQALYTWLRRKGGARPEVKEASIRLAETILEAEEVMHACTRSNMSRAPSQTESRQNFEADNFSRFRIFG